MAANLTLGTDTHCRDLGSWVQSGAVDMDMLHPEPMRWGANDAEAVDLCRRWMIYLGASDTVIAAGEARRACDLYSSRYLGWVDNRRGNLDLAFVERVAAVAKPDGRQALIFVPGGVLPQAQRRADELGIAVLGFSSESATLDGVNPLGWRFREGGLIAG